MKVAVLTHDRQAAKALALALMVGGIDVATDRIEGPRIELDLGMDIHRRTGKGERKRNRKNRWH